MAKICQYTGCGNPVFSKGYCQWHTARKPIEKSKDGKVKKIKPISDTMAKNLAKYRKNRDEYFKEHPVCEFPGCTSTKITLHHKRGRVGSLLWDKIYFCSLCPEHHTWVNEHNEAAFELGLSESRLTKND